MKMTKLLASGIAASLAVTSLAAVASATERTFEMGHTQGTIKFNASSGKEVNFLADKDGLAPAELGISSDDVLAIDIRNANMDITGVNLKVTGIKGSKSSSSRTYTYAFGNYATDAVGAQSGNKFDWDNQVYDGSGAFWAIKAYKEVGPVDSFVPSQFVEVTQVVVEIACQGITNDVKVYDAFGSTEWGQNLDGLVITPFATAEWTDILMAINNTLSVWGTDVTPVNGIYASYSEKSATDLYPFLPRTDIHVANGDAGQDARLDRDEIWLLSRANQYTATSGGLGSAGTNAGQDGNQTYDEVDYNKGTNPAHFAGLASQVGDFFNKQTNGKITFTFTTSSGATGTSWNVGGIPSSQVGIKNVLGDASANDFVLAFNYTQTGSLQAVASVDAAAGEISFDISDVLDALDGKTIGVIDNVYYGSTKGVEYTGDHPYAGNVGFEVQKITFSYDEDENSGNDIEEDDDDTDDDDDDDDTSDDVDDDDDDDDDDDTDADDDDDDTDASVDDDDDDDDDEGDVNGDIVTPSNNNPANDVNPDTGVALAVVPAMVAAAAVVVSKKRK